MKGKRRRNISNLRGLVEWGSVKLVAKHIALQLASCELLNNIPGSSAKNCSNDSVSRSLPANSVAELRYKDGNVKTTFS
jgi:hypothetical protein